MAQYIEKSAIVAEIENLRNQIQSDAINSIVNSHVNS